MSCQMAVSAVWERVSKREWEQQREEEEPDKGDRSFRKHEELPTASQLVNK